MKNVLSIAVFFILALNFQANAQEDPLDPAIRAIRESDPRSLSASFNLTIELRLPDNAITCSGSQAEMIMKDFFKKYPPDSFTVIEKGATDSLSRFAICNYLSGSRKYQVYLYMRQEKERFLIQKIQFEEKK
jgi:hypothetical protein